MSSSELITLYSIYDPTSGPFSCERKKFYDDQIAIKNNWEIHQYAPWVVNIFLVNKSWEIIVQKRSSHKRQNPNLLDKSIGGHIQRWDPVDYTVMVETVQELQVPSIVIRRDDSFEKRYELLRDYVNTSAIIKHIDAKLHKTTRIIDGEEIWLYNMVNVFFWVYGWSVKNVDKEAKWVLYYDIEELVNEMKEYPKLYTQDMHILINDYGDEIREFIDFVKKE